MHEEILVFLIVAAVYVLITSILLVSAIISHKIEKENQKKEFIQSIDYRQEENFGRYCTDDIREALDKVEPVYINFVGGNSENDLFEKRN